MVKPRLTLHHTTESDGLVTAHFNVPGFRLSMCALIIGRPRLKLRYHVLQNTSDKHPFNIYATLNHNDWYAVQQRFYFLDKEHRTEKGFIKTKIPIVGHKRVS